MNTDDQELKRIITKLHKGDESVIQDIKALKHQELKKHLTDVAKDILEKGEDT